MDIHSVSAENGDAAVQSTHRATSFQRFGSCQFVAMLRFVDLLDDEVAVTDRVEMIIGKVKVPDFFACFVQVN